MTNKYVALFNFFRTCPQLNDLWSIAANENNGTRVILPQGASPTCRYDERLDVLGNYNCEIVPFPSLYEDYQINCYEVYDANDASSPVDNYNVLTYESVCDICDWVKTQNANRNFPEIGEQVVSIECMPFVPQIRYVDEINGIVTYYITVRIRYVNRTRRVTVEYES